MNEFSVPANPVWGPPRDPTGFPHPESDFDVDVLIIGAGFSGLWSAIHLTSLDPTLSIAVIDAASPGFGASGRNGGWCSALMPMSLEAIAKSSSIDDARRMQLQMNTTVDEIGDFIRRFAIDCGWEKGGSLHSATNPAHLQRLKDEVQSYRAFGFGDEQISLLDQAEATDRINAVGTCGASYTPHCAVVNPLSLVNGILAECLSRGVRIYSRSRALSIAPHVVEIATPNRRIRATARWIVRATEGFTRTLARHRRMLAPIYSFMIATEPLPDSAWAEIGWKRRETFADARHMIIYAQRTADNRIAFGGRGAPYKWASGVSPTFDTNRTVHAMLESTMHELFPVTREARITHKWGGPLGLPRDWFSGVTFDNASGLITVGGYVGDGVALSHLAAQTAAHLITGTDSEITRLPWVGHVSPRWEPEPFRWIGINSLLRVPALADARERRTQRPSTRLARVLQTFVK